MLGTAPPNPPQRGVKGFLLLFYRQLWRYLVTGLMVWVPLIVTLWVVWSVVSGLGFGIERLIEDLVETLNRFGDRVEPFRFLTYLDYHPGLGFLVTLAVFLTTGLITRYLVARRAIRFGEGILERIPLISSIYRAVEQIRDVFVRREGTVFQKVCLIEYPRPGILVVGFVTSDEHGIVQETLSKELVAVFVPTTPNPTSGFLLYLAPDAITELDISVEDAMKLIVSAGAYIPPKAEKTA